MFCSAFEIAFYFVALASFGQRMIVLLPQPFLSAEELGISHNLLLCLIFVIVANLIKGVNWVYCCGFYVDF